MFYIYILESLKNKRLYIGQTDNIDKRLKRHNDGRVKSTKNIRPWILIYSENLYNRNDAIKRERYLKNLKNPDYIKKNIINKS